MSCDGYSECRCEEDVVDWVDHVADWEKKFIATIVKKAGSSRLGWAELVLNSIRIDTDYTSDPEQAALDCLEMNAVFHKD